MKGTENFENCIKNYLNDFASKDDAFYKKCQNPKKSLKDCITYILNRVQKSGQNGFEDAEIFGMAIHYFEEEEVDIGKDIKLDVVVNHRVELTEKEIKEEREKARNKIYQEEREKLVKRKGKTPNVTTAKNSGDSALKVIQPSLF